jgi:hypothetical protein
VGELLLREERVWGKSHSAPASTYAGRGRRCPRPLAGGVHDACWEAHARGLLFIRATKASSVPATALRANVASLPDRPCRAQSPTATAVPRARTCARP